MLTRVVVFFVRMGQRSYFTTEKSDIINNAHAVKYYFSI